MNVFGSQAVANQTAQNPPRPAVGVPAPDPTQPNIVPGATGGLGSSIWQYYAYGRAYSGVGVIGGNFDGYFLVLADSHSITFDYSVDTITSTWSSSVLSLAPTIHNGIAVTVPSGTKIRRVTVDPATNMAGFDASRISFAEGRIEVDWENLPFSPSTIVKLDIN